jgi:hypothetical protein
LRVTVISALLFLLSGVTYAQEVAQAAIPNVATTVPLFTISWNLTPNVVHYDANLKSGKFDPKEPVSAYWVMHTKGDQREPLTLIERLKGYGFSIRPGSEPNSYDMVIVSVKKKTLHIVKKADGFQITLSIATCKTAQLEKAHVQAHRWHFITVGDYVELTGTDLETGAKCEERVDAE